MSARDAILWLITTEKEWLEAFRLMCRHSPFRLRAQIWQFRDELRDRGHEFEHEELEDTLFELARILLPESPAAKWDTEWAAELVSKACRILNEHYIAGVDHSVFEPWAEKIDAAAEAEDRRAYREAVNGYLNEGLEAIESAQRIVA